MPATSNPPAFKVTRQSVLTLVWLVMLASITVPLMGITDTAVIGQLGDAALLGGLAVGAFMIDLVFTGLWLALEVFLGVRSVSLLVRLKAMRVREFALSYGAKEADFPK